MSELPATYDSLAVAYDALCTELAAANEARDALRAEVERLREALRKEAHIIFDGPPGPTGPHFVEVEDGSGRSIRCGEWRRDRTCYWSLVISGNDIAAIDAARKPEPRMMFSTKQDPTNWNTDPDSGEAG